jgi:hypothetical protein
MLRQAGVAPEALDLVVADRPALGGVGVHPSGVAVVPNVGAARAGQLDTGAGHDPVVDEVGAIDGVDLDGLLARVHDVDVVDQGAVRRGARGRRHVDRVIVGLAQGDVGDGHAGGGDLDDLAGRVIPVQDHRFPATALRAKGDVRRPDSEGRAVEVVDAVGDQDRDAGGGAPDGGQQSADGVDTHGGPTRRRERGAVVHGVRRRDACRAHQEERCSRPGDPGECSRAVAARPPARPSAERLHGGKSSPRRASRMCSCAPSRMADARCDSRDEARWRTSENEI